ncbi:MAG: asparagine synthase (glutamine-hydrolyzing) [Thermoplasmatota archaeon]
MCGIAGILGRGEPALAQGMATRLAHRGPDGASSWADDQVSFAHRRLAIIDVSAGRQPWAEEGLVLLWNGEVYNHPALRSALEREGVRFATQSDTEVLWAAWKRWENPLDRFEGMFAIAAWETQRRTLTLARDRWGVKPLYFTLLAEGELLFASEMKAFGAHPAFRFVPDEASAAMERALEFLPGTATPFAGVYQVPPGFRLDATAHSTRLTRWARPRRDVQVAPDVAARRLAKEVEASVQGQLLADVPVGTVLSGGLDSSLVAALHAKHSAGAVHTFTVADSEAVPDFQAARRVAGELGTTHHEALFGAEDLERHLADWIWHQEHAHHEEFFFWPLFALARRHVKVALCGQGADELWGGYARYRDPHALRDRRLAALGRGHPLGATLERSHADAWHLARWDQEGQLANFQLRLADRASMAHSVEARVPFLSSPLQAASDATPWSWKVNAGTEKWVLRKAARILGLKDAERPKLPAGRQTAPRAVDAFERQARRILPASPTPAYDLCRRVWRELFVEGVPAATVELGALG